ncbi:MAG: N-acetylneuraminate synthase family protein [Kiritimatiellia bacterium]|jgi:N-acetylneuraminate synthase
MNKPKTHIEINGRRIGPGEPCYIIAEVGVNHNGDLDLAKKIVDAAVQAGVDAVKFQKRKLSQVYQQAILDQPRQGEQGLQYLVPLLVEFELSDDKFRELAAYCRQQRIAILCTPWDRISVDFLETLDLPAYKIGSPDMTNWPLIEYILKTGKPMLLSTGMSTEDEIRRTLAFLKERDAECALFHCVSTYPASAEEINLRFMQTLREWSGWPVGYSGHDTGIAISLAAVAMGACLLERHLTLDRNMRGPDHSASLEPDMFAEQVRAVREVEASLGVPHRWITRGELLNRRVLAKSLSASEDIPAGTTLTRDMITSKSPGLGLSPQLINKLVGRRTNRNLRQDDFFVDGDLRDPEHPRQLKTIEIGAPWGIIARFTDIDHMLLLFEKAGMSLVEFHVSDRDLDEGIKAFPTVKRPYDLVVHAAEYFYDHLIDLCSANEEQRRWSVKRIQQTIDLVRKMAPWFRNTFPRGPKIVFHVGGMSRDGKTYNVATASERLLESLRQLDTTDVDLLLENLPPYPWYFGGRWFGHVLTDAENTAQLCADSGLGLCFDVSHAALECCRSGAGLLEFTRRCLSYIRHVHASDGAGTSGEGLQIGEGQVNFVELMPVLLQNQPSLVPEIWMGHHQDGKGFQIALERLTEIVWASKVLRVKPTRPKKIDVSHLVVASSATVLTTLQTIDANKMGIAFVVDEIKVVLGVITDGDIRHALARGQSLNSPIAEIMTRNFVFGRENISAAEIRAHLPGRSRIMPILDADHRLTDYASDQWPE